MTSRVSSSGQKPMAVIFLGVQGVLTPSNALTNVKVRRTYAEKFSAMNYHGKFWQDIYLKRANTHHFSRTATGHLMNLIEKVSQERRVGIVISSKWKEELTLAHLQQDLFADKSFRRYIIGKTRDDLDGEEAVQAWLDENQKIENVETLAIIDPHLSIPSSSHLAKHCVPVDESQLFTEDNEIQAHAILTQSQAAPDVKSVPAGSPPDTPSRDLPVGTHPERSSLESLSSSQDPPVGLETPEAKRTPPPLTCRRLHIKLKTQ